MGIEEIVRVFLSECPSVREALDALEIKREKRLQKYIAKWREDDD